MIERVYTIPLRKEYLKVPRWRRAEKSMKFIREFIARHMKTELDNVIVGNDVNEHVWQFGGKDVPTRIKVVVRKTDDKAEVHLFGYKWPEKEEKKEKKKEVKKPKKVEEKKESKKEEKEEKASEEGEAK